MTLASVNQWLSAVALLIGIVNALWIWLSRPARDTNKRIDEANDRVDDLIKEQNDRADRHRENLKDHDRRLQRVEDDLRHLPTKDDIHALGRQLTAMKTELDIVARVVTRVDETMRTKP